MNLYPRMQEIQQQIIDPKALGGYVQRILEGHIAVHQAREEVNQYLDHLTLETEGSEHPLRLRRRGLTDGVVDSFTCLFF